MFRQRLRLPHHLTFGVLPRISGRPQRPSCSRSRTRFPGDRRTLLPLGSALTSPSCCFLFPPFASLAARARVFQRRVGYYPRTFFSTRPSEFEEILIPTSTIKFFAVLFYHVSPKYLPLFMGFPELFVGL